MSTPFVPIPRCPKCQSDNVTKEFHETCAVLLAPHLHLTCATCRDTWCEDTADKVL
jgi:hypothetical protein